MKKKITQKESDKILIVSKDSVRTLRKKNDQPKARGVVVMDKNELQRIRVEARSISDRQQGDQESKAALEAAAMERKIRMMELDAQKRFSDTVEASPESQEERNSILARAKKQMEDREDEIKKMNEFILEAKCMAVREAQISEKKAIEEALKYEELRLDAVMEYDRVRALEEQYELEKIRKVELKQGADVVKTQIERRREAALLEADKRDQEAKKMLEELARQNELELKKKELAALQRKHHLNVILEANSESINRKKMEKSRSKEEDKKILSYLIEKAQREEEKEKLEKLKKAEKEKEYAKLRSMQEKLQDKQAQQDALRAKRATEEYEREWRKKEKEAAEKKLKQEAELKESRLKQTLMRDHVMAVEALKARQEFMEMVKRQKETEVKLSVESEAKKSKNQVFAQCIKDQIETKEQQKRCEKEQFQTEGKKLQKERKERKDYIDGIISKKLEELRVLGVPETQCMEIQRKMKLMERMKISDQPSVIKKSVAAPVTSSNTE